MLKSIPASPLPKSCILTMALSLAWRLETWASVPTENPVTGSHVAWSCAAKYTLIAEGARGSLSKQLIKHFKLDADDCDPQKYGIGLKELWEIPAGKAQAGLMCNIPSAGHSTTPPAGDPFSITMATISSRIGFVVHLNYTNPYLSPYDEFQRFKTHPLDCRTARRRSTHRLWRTGHH